jgi:hypothetical protein
MNVHGSSNGRVVAAAAVFIMSACAGAVYAEVNPWHVTDYFTVFRLDVTTSGFKDTGVDILPGTRWVVMVHGIANTAWQGGNPASYPFANWVGPGGIARSLPAGSPMPFPDGPSQCVIGKLGDQGEVFYVGPGGQIEGTSQSNGRLYLGYNDTIFWDNFGYYVVYLVRFEPADLTGLGEGSNLPSIGPLTAKNLPNPFNPATTIEYSVPREGNVSVRVYNAGGELVRMLVEGFSDSGTHSVVWDGRDDRGFPVASGTYFYLVRQGNETLSRKAVLVR